MRKTRLHLVSGDGIEVTIEAVLDGRIVKSADF
jgi:hypothetical protein